MKLIYRLFALAAVIFLSSCGTFKSGLTIPANQTFLLGEFNNKRYSADLKNRSDLDVFFQAVDKESGRVTQSFGLGPKGKVKVNIGSYETVQLINKNSSEVRIDVVINKSKGVEGMRYIGN